MKLCTSLIMHICGDHRFKILSFVRNKKRRRKKKGSVQRKKPTVWLQATAAAVKLYLIHLKYNRMFGSIELNSRPCRTKYLDDSYEYILNIVQLL
jgi:hypothetical protein